MKKSNKLTILLLSLVAIIMLSIGITFGMSDATYAETDGAASEGSGALNVASVTTKGVVTNYETLADAVKAAESDATESGAIITLIENVSENITFKKDKDITLDLGGKTITAAKEDEDKAAILNDGGTVTVRNGTILRTADTSYYVIKNRQGSLTLEDLKVSNDNAEDGASLICNESDGVDPAEKATLTVKSGSYTAKNNQSNVIKNGAGDELIIEGGTFTMNGGVSGAHTVLTCGDITVTGGTFTASKSSGTVNAICIRVSVKDTTNIVTTYVKKVNISNAKIDCTNKCGYGIYVCDTLTGEAKVDVDITGCTILNTSYAIYFPKTLGKHTVDIVDTTIKDSNYGIKITSTNIKTEIAAKLSDNNVSTSTSSISYASISIDGCGMTPKERVQVNVIGGIYTNIKLSNDTCMTVSIGEGTKFVILPKLYYNTTDIVYLQDESGNFVASSFPDAVNAGFAATWIGQPFETLQEAITKSTNSKAPIILLKDVTECVAFSASSVPTTRTLDLNGQTLTDVADQNLPTITVNVNMVLTLLNGTVTNTSGQPAITNSGTKLTLKSGTYTGAEGQPAVLNNGTNLIVEGGEFNGGLSVESGTAKISGGKFNGELLLSGDGSSYSISRGTFSVLPKENYLSTNIVIKQEESGFYTAIPFGNAADEGYLAKAGALAFKSLQAAIDSAESNETTVTLLKDVTESVKIGEMQTIILGLNTHTLTDAADQNKPTITNEGTLTLLNGKITNTSGQPAIANAGTLTVKSGTYTSAEGRPAIFNNGTNLTVEGGEFNGGLSTESGTTAISGGKFNGELLLSGDGSSYSISGGAFSVLPKENYLADSIAIKQDESLYYNALPLADAAVDSVAKIGVYYYTTLSGAVADVRSGATVTLLKDMTESVTVSEDKDFTLDLGGFTLSNDTESPTITNEGTLNITNGTDTNGAVLNSSAAHAAILNKKTLTLTDGIFTASGNPSIITESGTTTICGGEFSGGLAFGSDKNAACVVMGGYYTVSSLADLNLAKITFEHGYVAYISVVSVSTFALRATDEFNVTVSDIETAVLIKDDIEIVAGKDDENLSDMGFRINADFAQVQTETGYEVVDLETYKEIAVADVVAYADEVGVPFEESYTAAIVAATTFADVDKAAAAAKKQVDKTLKIEQAKQEACKYVMSYAMAKNVEYTSEIDSIINGTTFTTLVGVESAKSAAIAKVDEIYEAAKAEKERLKQAKEAALAEIRRAAAATEATQTEAAQAAVHIPVATLAAICGAEDTEQVEEYKLAALAEIANIRTMRGRIEELKVDGEAAIHTLDVLKETLSVYKTNVKEFDAALRTLDDILDIVNQELDLYSSSELLNIELKVKEAITNAVNVLELAIGDSVYSMTKHIESLQNKVGDITKTFGIAIDEETTDLITDGLNEVKTTISQIDGNLLTAYNDIDSKLKAANTAISNANSKLDSLGETVISGVNEVLESDAFIVLAKKCVADVNAALTEFSKNLQSDEHFGDISALKAALEKSVADVTSAAEELSVKLEAAGADVSGIETAVYAIDSDNLSSVAQCLGSVQTEIESAIAEGVTSLTEKLTTITKNFGTLTGKLKEANSGISTEIEELSDGIANLESETFDTITVNFFELHTELERIDKKVQTAVGVEAEKIKASESIKKTLDNLLGVDAATPEAADDSSDGGATDAQREKLNNLYSEENAVKIENYYKEANTAVANATTVEEAKAATDNFKSIISGVEPVQSGDVKKTVSLYLVYLMFGIVLLLLFVILLIVLFKKGRTNYYYADSEGWDDDYGGRDDAWDDEYHDDDGFEEDYKD